MVVVVVGAAVVDVVDVDVVVVDGDVTVAAVFDSSSPEQATSTSARAAALHRIRAS